jgi:hypothetical protein
MTILNHHSVAELRDWLAAIDYQIAQIAAAYAAFAPVWQSRDAATHHDWSDDWKALQTRYGVARAKALGAIARAQLEFALPDSMIPVEDEWQGVLHALSHTPGVSAKGDFQDLHDRIVVAEGKPIDFSKMPQPTATDADLGAYKAADAAIRAGEAAAHQLTPSKGTGTLIIVGLGLILGVVVATKSVLR